MSVLRARMNWLVLENTKGFKWIRLPNKAHD